MQCSCIKYNLPKRCLVHNTNFWKDFLLKIQNKYLYIEKNLRYHFTSVIRQLWQLLLDSLLLLWIFIINRIKISHIILCWALIAMFLGQSLAIIIIRIILRYYGILEMYYNSTINNNLNNDYEQSCLNKKVYDKSIFFYDFLKKKK